MKILHITDSHGTVKTPESRTDLFYITFLKKLAEITYVINLYKIDMVIHTGDLFHTSRVSNKFMGQAAEIIKSWNIPLYVVPGNHDIDGYTISTIDQTSLGLLAKTGVLKLLTRDNPIRKEIEQNGYRFSVAISGQEYYPTIDTGNTEDYEMQQDEADINILAIHSYIADTPQHPNIRCTYPKDIITDADIILTGHYHRSFAMDVGDTSYYNPGSMLRVEMTDYNKKHMPQYGILEIELDKQGYVVYDYKFHQFRIAKPSNQVFDFNSTGAIKKHGVTLENFKTSIANTMQSINVNLGTTPLETIENTIKQYCKANSYGINEATQLYNSAQMIYNTASKTITDEDVVTTKGFIPVSVPIRVKSIDIENFQSHENTHVDFNNGLNVIVGESNNGKTSILRAMDWVVDNHPLGTDFIMTGKNYCKVKITYDNCTFIERYRTLKDTGYYRVGYIAGGQEIYQEYKGFANNIPVEVMNAHQMPKVAITKNIETHLNKISQLERPFLITENTNEKAAAIGKITGTDIVDSGIKNMTSQIASDRKSIKTMIKMKEELEVKKALIDIDKLSILRTFYTKSSDKLIEVYNLYNAENNLKTARDNCIKDTKYYTSMVKKCESITKHETKVYNAEKLILQIKDMLSLYGKYQRCINGIKKTEDEIKINTEIKKQKIRINNCGLIINKVLTMLDLFKDKQSNEILIDSLNKSIIKFNIITSRVQDCIDGEAEINTMRNILNLYRSNQFAQSNIQKVNDDSSCILATIGNLNLELEEQQNAMTEYVLSNKICPCCGQEITDKNVSSIISNFSRRG